MPIELIQRKPKPLFRGNAWRRKPSAVYLSTGIRYRDRIMAKKFLHPSHPERICWGCDRYCSAESMGCGNGASRTQHPSELFGEDWAGEWEVEGTEDAKEQEAPARQA